MDILKAYEKEINSLQERSVEMVNKAFAEFVTSAKNYGSIKKIDWSCNMGIVLLEFKNKGPHVASCGLADFLDVMDGGDITLYDDEREAVKLSGFSKEAAEEARKAIEVVRELDKKFGGPVDSNMERLFRERLTSKPVNKGDKKGKGPKKSF